MPRSEDMRLEPSLNVTPEGSLTDIPTVVKRETREQVPEGEMLGISSETTYMEIPGTNVKTVHKSPTEYLKSYNEQKKQVEKKRWHQHNNFLLLLIEEMLEYPLEVN